MRAGLEPRIPAAQASPADTGAGPGVVDFHFVITRRISADACDDDDVVLAVRPERSITAHPVAKGLYRRRHRWNRDQAQSLGQRDDLRVLDSLVCFVQIDGSSIDRAAAVCRSGPEALF